MKNYLGECSLKITRPNGERSEILVSNPVSIWISVSGKNTSGFSDLVFALVSGFSNLVYSFSEIMLVERKPAFMFKTQVRGV